MFAFDSGRVEGETLEAMGMRHSGGGLAASLCRRRTRLKGEYILFFARRALYRANDTSVSEFHPSVKRDHWLIGGGGGVGLFQRSGIW